MRLFVVLAIIVPLAVQATKVAKCDRNTPLPDSVEVAGCDRLPCSLKRGTDSLTEVKLTLPSDTATLAPYVKAKVGGLTVPYPLPPHLNNACDHLNDGAQCPLKKGDQVTYNLKVPVLQSYPSINLDLMVSLVDDSNESVVCFKIPCKVV
ncbi:NPC intracellular cholesterol transporter 2 homolog a-like [Ctenocephalides felis]|uniref:NPC intracellular cholesterol transporter 2 homolog a-like n=1 Tax=Ctenocephalides felis TaxID=7515 RepID=UPI000E6E25AD|nr:NPC intracellular cholesterol transporter 2 homolog a-like [Ctenocephalides felis]XP_026476351.1 NPC intracellular cholesterol transporter 2 homolog a-like [Ctenocephalides felis]